MTALESSPTTHAEVVKAIYELLTEGWIPDFNEKNVRISDEGTDPPASFRGPYWVVIWPVGGRFDQTVYDGAGLEGVFEDAGVAITVFRRNTLDHSGEANDALLNSETGLMELKRLILKRVLQAGRLERDQKFLLTDYISPRTADVPREGSRHNGGIADLYLEFATPFSWDLTDAPTD